MDYLLAVLLGYLLGSFPTGFLAGRFMSGVDVRKMGSGRTGGSNVLRSAGSRAGFVTIAGDVLKGILAVVLARMIWGDPAATALAGIFSVVGHNYSIFLAFAGGAGTMTNYGVLLGLDPIVFLLVAIVPFIFTVLTRMSSVGSLLTSSLGLLIAVILVWQGYFPPAYLIYFVPFFLLSWYSHRPNIERLQAGTERRIGEKAKELREQEVA